MVVELRGPIGSHSSATSDSSWDGPANERRLRDDESPSYYRRAYAWQDPDEAGDAKAHYRFIHHEVSSDGSIGAANIQACVTGIGVLNGGRGGTTIPSGDRQGVHNHLAKHMRDAGADPPDLRSTVAAEPGFEYRAFSVNQVDVERRDADEEPELRLSGYAAVFDEPTNIAGMFIEVIRRGAFRRAIAEGQDVALLLNHDPSTVMARTSNDSLRLREDDIGLWFEARLDPRDADAQRTVTKIENRNITQMSFAFQVTPEGERWSKDEVPPLREIIDVNGLWDVSPVTYPAYSETDVHAREYARGRAVVPPQPDRQQSDSEQSRQQLRQRQRIQPMREIGYRKVHYQERSQHGC